MTMLERDIEARLTRTVRQHGGRCLKWVCPGWAGVPDRIVLLPGGRVVFVELKRPKGGRLSDLQKWWSEQLIDMGFAYWTIWSKEELELFRKTHLEEGR